MDETFRLSVEERTDSDQWQIGASSVLSMDSNTSLYFQKIFHLNLIQTKKVRSERQIIPSTKTERLSYFRAYVSSMDKTQIICMQHKRFNMFLWYYVLTTMFKSLPHTYTYIFLAVYSCEEHLFLSKMVPLCIGFKVASIIASVLELVSYVDTSLFILDYIYHGILFKNPWNRCYSLPVSYYYKFGNVSWQCYNINEFSQKIEEIINNNGTISFVNYYYQSLNETFQLAQIEYYRGRNLYFNDLQIGTVVSFCLLWIPIALFHKQVYKKLFWKILDKVQWSVNGIDLISFIYLSISYFYTELDISHDTMHEDDNAYADILWKADVDMLAESTTSPPVVHVLTARGLGEIEPSSDSAMMITSNALLYIFRGLLHFRVKIHCENMIRVPIFLTVFNQHTWFYLWPLFFSKFYMGDIFTLVFLIVNFIMELLIIMVTYHCIVEVIVCEYSWLKNYVTIILTVVGIGVFVGTSFTDRVLFYVFSASIITLIETVLLYYMYPIGRLVDDITFHYGFPPTSLRVLSFQLVPIYYSIKFYVMIKAFIQFILKAEMAKSVPHYKWSWSVVVIPIVLGAFYNSYVYVVKYKKEWKHLLRPDPTWGPTDYVSRNLRKQYDSRTYIGSQAPKDLGRDLLSKTESKAYKLDVRYDSSSRRPTMPKFDALRDDIRK